jgi:hypothetical protein
VKNYRELYQVEWNKLDALAAHEFTHVKHLCENMKEYPQELQDMVCKILRVQLDLLVKINRQTQLPFTKGF